MNKITIAITGHRDIRPEDREQLKERLREKLLPYRNSDQEIKILVGSAEGTDQIAREIATELQLEVLDLDALCPRATEKDDAQYFKKQGQYLVAQAAIVLAVWDGIFNQKAGGTSDVFAMALAAKKELWQLVCPRIQNPYPVAHFLQEAIDFKKRKFNRIPIAVHFSWVAQEYPPVHPPVAIPFSERLMNYVSQDLIGNYAVPAIWVLLSVFMGILGFYFKNPADGNLNHLFNAVNLLTFNASVIDDGSNLLLDFARVLGLGFVGIGFFIAFVKVSAHFRKDWERKKWQKFTMVLGLNELSLPLIRDLTEKHHKKLIVVNQNPENLLEEELARLPNVFLVNGRLSSGTLLKKLNATQAEEIYFFSEQDADNIRAAQELDLLSIAETASQAEPDRFVHLQDQAKRRFLHQSLSTNSSHRSIIFNVFENAVRSLLLYYPIDRFYQNTAKEQTAHVVLIGFEQMGQALALALLKQGHYTEDKQLKISVLCANHAEAEKTFLSKYPQFTQKFEHDFGSQIIKTYTWRYINLYFEEMPLSEHEWMAQKSIFASIQENTVGTLISTLSDGVQAAAILENVLPKLNQEKVTRNANFQVFCYYNFPDKEEERIIESHFNEVAPNIFFKCYGNFIDECSYAAIHNRALDALPKLINAKYAEIPFEKTDKIDIEWQIIPEKNKSSSRQAADHLWVKLRMLWPEIEWKFDPITFEPFDEVKERLETKENYEKYGEIEHRRWCAEMLLAGFRPITEDTKSELYHTVATRWVSKKPEDKVMKKDYEYRFEHIDLVPFDQLKSHEAAKDIEQLKAIPAFLRGVVETKKSLLYELF